MKLKVIAPFLAAAFLAGLAAAQSKTGADKKDAVPKDPLPLVKLASNVASNIQDRNLNSFLGLYIDSQSWASGLKDSDLGPFLKLKEPQADRSAVLFFSPEKDTAVIVFFDGGSVTGVASAKAKSGKIEAGDMSAVKPVTKEMLKDSRQDLQFNKIDLTTDDGDALTGFQVTSAAKKPAN